MWQQVQNPFYHSPYYSTTNCHTETHVSQEHATQVLVWVFPRNIAWIATAVRKTKA
jgi:hypothetical protein